MKYERGTIIETANGKVWYVITGFRSRIRDNDTTLSEYKYAKFRQRPGTIKLSGAAFHVGAEPFDDWIEADPRTFREPEEVPDRVQEFVEGL